MGTSLKRIVLAFALLLVAVISAGPLSAEMSGGDFRIYADVFSSVQGEAQTGGQYAIFQSGGEFSSGNIESGVAQGTIEVTGLDMFDVGFANETFTIPDGSTSTVFTMTNLGGSFNGYCIKDFQTYGQPCNGLEVVIDIGGGCDLDCLVANIVEAVNTSTHLLVTAATSSNTVINLTNTNPNEVGDEAIVEDVDPAEFVVSGMTASGAGTILRGGYQAMEIGSISMSVNTTSMSLGTLSASSVASSSLAVSVTSESDTGYGVTISEDGNLRRAADGTVDSNNIDDVADGSVTAGSEEYGIVTSGNAALLAVDTPISDGSLSIASNAAQVTAEITTTTFKASVDTTKSRAGSYSHTVTFTVSANP